MPRILLICVYYGPFPFWFPVFLISCRYNLQIDWLIVSDNEAPPNTPDNVQIRKMDLEAFNETVSRNLELDVRFTKDNLYRLVDIKTALGAVFEEDTRGYDFWGFCDMDIIWGDMRKFLDPALLKRFDIITSRVKKISGHFCIFKNTPELRTIYTRIPNYLNMIQGSEWCKITEPLFTAYLTKQLKNARLRRMIGWLRNSPPFCPPVFWNAIWSTPGREQRRVGSSWKEALIWKEGSTFTIGGREVMYLHFHILKKTIKHCEVGYSDDPKEIAVTNSQIIMR